jgi:hypothetical protein
MLVASGEGARANVSLRVMSSASQRTECFAMQAFNNAVKLNFTDSRVGNTALVFLHHRGGSSQN